jgi:hypothetical protein
VRDQEKFAKFSSAKEERHKNFSWLEEQQATLNQQVHGRFTLPYCASLVPQTSGSHHGVNPT